MLIMKWNLGHGGALGRFTSIPQCTCDLTNDKLNPLSRWSSGMTAIVFTASIRT
jgi:hypothetical protein